MNNPNEPTAALDAIKKAQRTAIPLNKPHDICNLNMGVRLEKRSDDEDECASAHHRGHLLAIVDSPQKFAARFTRLESATKTATFSVPARHTKHGRVTGRAVFGEDGLPAGRVTNAWKATAGSVDVDCQLNDAAWSKAQAGALSGITLETDSGGNSYVKLTDNLNTDATTDAPNWVKLAKAEGDDGYAATADVIKSLHTRGGRPIDLAKSALGLSVLDTYATTDPKQLRKHAQRKRYISNLTLATATDSLEIFRALLAQGPQRRIL